MKAMHYRCYGPPEVLQARARRRSPRSRTTAAGARCTPRRSIRSTGTSCAASRTSCACRRASVRPRIARIGVGLLRHGRSRWASASRASSRVTKSSAARRALSREYVRGARDRARVALKPANVSHEQAAAIPIAAITALQALRDQGHLKAGQKVLVNGASGGVGTYAVQTRQGHGRRSHRVSAARAMSTWWRRSAPIACIDYKNVDFARRRARYDLIIDTVGNRDLRDLQTVLEPGGIAVIVGGPSVIRGLARLSDSAQDHDLRAIRRSATSSSSSPSSNQKDLEYLAHRSWQSGTHEVGDRQDLSAGRSAGSGGLSRRRSRARQGGDRRCSDADRLRRERCAFQRDRNVWRLQLPGDERYHRCAAAAMVSLGHAEARLSTGASGPILARASDSLRGLPA